MKIVTVTALFVAAALSQNVGRAESRTGSFVTSKGADFERVENFEKFGPSWQSPDGRIWSAYRGQLTNNPGASEAMRECAKAGGKLPEAGDFEALASFFEANSNGTYFSALGQKELYTLFPFMKGRWFWSASFYPSADHPEERGYYAFNDHGYNGIEANFITNDERAGVICLAQEP